MNEDDLQHALSICSDTIENLTYIRHREIDSISREAWCEFFEARGLMLVSFAYTWRLFYDSKAAGKCLIRMIVRSCPRNCPHVDCQSLQLEVKNHVTPRLNADAVPMYSFGVWTAINPCSAGEQLVYFVDIQRS